MARIAIGGFLHETNCFVPMRTGYEYYARGGDFPPLARGDEVIERTRGSSYGQPSAQKILVLKSTCHFRADFQPIAAEILIAVAPGAHLVDSTQYPFRHLRPGVRLSPMGPEFRPGKE